MSTDSYQCPFCGHEVTSAHPAVLAKYATAHEKQCIYAKHAIVKPTRPQVPFPAQQSSRVSLPTQQYTSCVPATAALITALALCCDSDEVAQDCCTE